jgi:hypothetical protein
MLILNLLSRLRFRSPLYLKPKAEVEEPVVLVFDLEDDFTLVEVEDETPGEEETTTNDMINEAIVEAVEEPPDPMMGPHGPYDGKPRHGYGIIEFGTPPPVKTPPRGRSAKRSSGR